MRTLLALLALVGFVLSTVLGLVPSTRAGVQCPTATVQTVTFRDCCGRLMIRAPRPGETTFKQCRCAEKRQGALKIAASPRNEALPPARHEFEISSNLVLFRTVYVYAMGRLSHLCAPAVRPPTVS